ncbi:tripartite motif-containing protein 3-like [Saccostrea cucullata]|uniref:tripartite motif-containing protein 3-like n=1 Tax=Saccostrea cuccullata TaxID=36930 RepID=UPI002ECFB096
MATSLNKLNTEKLKEFLKCSLCQNTFDENEHSPRLLDCLHSFCLNCLQKKLSNNSFCCPNCNESNDFRGRAITDLQVDKRWEVYQKFVEVFSERDQILCGNCKRNNESVVIFCQQCSFFLCGECDKAHKIWSDFQNHTVFAIENLKGDWSVLKNIAHAGISKCQVPNHLHQEQKFYCTNQNCSKPICAECCLAEHQTHAFISLQEHINMVQSKLAEQLEILQKNVKQYQENRKLCQEEEDRLSNLESRLYKEIDDSFNICIKLMQGRREVIKANLRESVELKKTDFQKGIDECEQFQNSCMHLKEFLNTFKMLGDPSFLIEIFPVIIKRMRSLNEKTLTCKPDDFSHFEYDVDTFTTSVKAFVKTLGNVKDLSVSSEHSFIELPEKAVVHQTIEIFIHLKDDTGTPFSSQINGISLYINSSEEKGVKFTATWSDAKYSLKWKPDIQGKYTCRVLVQNHDVNVASEIFICENTDQVAQLKPQKETDNVKDTKSKAIQVKEAGT